MAAFGTRARGRSRQRHLDLQLLEGVAKALPRQGAIQGSIIWLALALAHADAAACDWPAKIAVDTLSRIDW
jgi:hypothetical protein